MTLSATIPLPPDEFRSLVCGPNMIDSFEEVGKWLVAFLDHEGMIKSGSDLLDVGCGCGRLARYLTDSPIQSYRGFDRHAGMVKWCVDEIQSRDPRFAFEFFNLRSVYDAWDNQGGKIDVESFTFPYPADAFDSCLLASIFTHMPPQEVRRYLRELGRVMRPGGKIVLSIFFSPDGEVQTLDEGVNVFHNPQEFAADLASSAFSHRRVGHRYVRGEGFQPDDSQPPLASGYVHNWHVLTKR